MSESIATFRMMLIARKTGWCGYIIGQYDEPGWMQRSMESFLAEAAKAGRRAMEIKAPKLSE
jgi:hypothetical protein